MKTLEQFEIEKDVAWCEQFSVTRTPIQLAEEFMMKYSRQVAKAEDKIEEYVAMSRLKHWGKVLHELETKALAEKHI